MSITTPPSPLSPVDSSRSSTRSSTPRTKLSLDLSNLPHVVYPDPPSNTIIITRLNDPTIFEPENLQTIRNIINNYGAIHTWSPFKSFSRIIVVFYDMRVAKAIKESLDGETIMDCSVRIYFANHTNLSPTSRYLVAPKLDKQFFISPPPSPPHDWESRNEGPPNKTVHADDLAIALSKLHARHTTRQDEKDVEQEITILNARERSSSVTVVYHPEHHGSNPNLPAINVEDTTFVESPVEALESPMEDIKMGHGFHTARPPVELMNE